MALAAVLSAAGVAGSLALAPAAQATDPLSAYIEECYNTNTYTFYCMLSISGGTQPYTVVWHGVRNANLSNSTTYGTSGSCARNYTSEVTVTVTDATGQSATGDYTFMCGTPPQ